MSLASLMQAIDEADKKLEKASADRAIAEQHLAEAQRAEEKAAIEAGALKRALLMVEDKTEPPIEKKKRGRKPKPEGATIVTLPPVSATSFGTDTAEHPERPAFLDRKVPRDAPTDAA